MTVFRGARLAAAAVGALMPAAAVHAAFAATLAQQASGGDRTRVIAWTIGIVVLAMVLLAIGYVYLRAVGREKPPPVPLLEPGQRITED